MKYKWLDHRNVGEGAHHWTANIIKAFYKRDVSDIRYDGKENAIYGDEYYDLGMTRRC